MLFDKEKVIERNEYFIDTSSGMTLYTAEKKLKGSSPSQAVLLIHGTGVGYACWDIDIKDYSMMEFLAREDFDVFAVDQRGYGKSTKPNGLDVSSESCADDLKSVIDYMKTLTQLEKVDVVGHSFGGMVATYLAAKYPEHIGKIVLMGCPYKILHPAIKPFSDEMVEVANKGTPYAPNTHHLTVGEKLYSYEQEVVDAYKELNDRLYPEIPTGVYLSDQTLEHSQYASQIAAPTLLLVGNFDNCVELHDQVEFLKDLGASDKALLVIGQAWHLVFLEKIAHRSFYQAVLDWLH